jgi:hypothetical protein
MKSDAPPPVMVKGKYLHSPYNPEREAEKILAKEDYSRKRILILFEPGLGYIIPPLRSIYPHLKLLVISPLGLLAAEYKKKSSLIIWSGDLEAGLTGFLSEQIHESDLSDIAYLPWPSAVRLLPLEASRAGKTLSRFMTRLQANHSHVIGFGRKNLRNSLINFLLCDAPRLPDLRHRSVLIVASGPGLRDCLGEIRKKSRFYFVIALPSAVSFLKKENIPVNLIISTDPGYWASIHYGSFPDSVPVGTGISGRCLFSRGRTVFPLFNQGTYLDNQLLGGTSIPSIPGTGSVALAALEWASAMRCRSITFAGLDMCLRDIRSHVSPHPFDNLLMAGSCRTNNLHHIYFDRAVSVTLARVDSLRISHSLNQYREWLENKTYPQPLFRLQKKGVSLKGLTDTGKLEGGPEGAVTWSPLPYPDRKARRERIMTLLGKWRQESQLRMNRVPSADFPDDFDDFVYTLIPEIFCRIRGESGRGIDSQSSTGEGREKLAGLFTELEALFERLA